MDPSLDTPEIDRYIRVCPSCLEAIHFREQVGILYGRSFIDEIPTCNNDGELLYWLVFDTVEQAVVLGIDGLSLKGARNEDLDKA